MVNVQYYEQFPKAAALFVYEWYCLVSNGQFIVELELKTLKENPLSNNQTKQQITDFINIYCFWPLGFQYHSCMAYGLI